MCLILTKIMENTLHHLYSFPNHHNCGSESWLDNSSWNVGFSLSNFVVFNAKTTQIKHIFIKHIIGTAFPLVPLPYLS